MRTSRDLLRPVAALVVVVAAIALATNVAAYRAATTPTHVTKPTAARDEQHAVGRAERAERREGSQGSERRADGDGDSDADAGRSRRSGDGRRVVVVTESGAS